MTDLAALGEAVWRDRQQGSAVVRQGCRERRGHGGGRSAGVCWPDHEEETPHDAHASFRRRRGRPGPSTPCRRRCGAARDRQGRAAELVAGALDQPGAAARAWQEPPRGRGDERRGGAEDGSGEGERSGDLSLRGRDDRPEGGAWPAGDRRPHRGGRGHHPARDPRAAAAPGAVPGLLAGRRDLPADARPFRERRSGERRPGRVEGPPRSDEEPLLPRRRPARGDRSPAVPEGPRGHRDLAQPLVRQRQPPERARDLRRAGDHRLPRLRRGGLLRGRGAARRPRHAAGAGGPGARARDQGDPGPGGEPQRSLSPVGGGLADAHVVLRHAGEAPREHLADVDAPGPVLDARDAEVDPRGLVHRHPARPGPGRPRGGAVHHPEHAVVGGGERARRDPPGHAAVRPPPLLEGVDGGHQEGVPGPPGGGGAVRRRPRARLVLPGRRGALRRPRLRGRHPLRLPDVLQDPRRFREERLAAGRGDDARRATTCTATRPRSSPSSAFTTCRAS